MFILCNFVLLGFQSNIYFVAGQKRQIGSHFYSQGSRRRPRAEQAALRKPIWLALKGSVRIKGYVIILEVLVTDKFQYPRGVRRTVMQIPQKVCALVRQLNIRATTAKD